MTREELFWNYQQNIGIPSPLEVQYLDDWLEKLPPDVVNEAVSEAVLNNKKNMRRKKGLPISTNRLPALFKLVTQTSGIYVTPHMMRHFFATQGVLSGVPIEHMAAALGHSTSYMTEKYTHIQEEVSASVTDNFLKAIK